MIRTRSPLSPRKQRTDALPRLAPIEEIEGSTDWTRLQRKVRELESNDQAVRSAARRSAAALLSKRRRTTFLLLLLLVFAAGCALGGSVIFLTR